VEASTHQVHPISRDITNKKALDGIFEMFVSIAGKIDVLVSNAGYGAVDGPIKDPIQMSGLLA
jgi:NAD(P)-dependent dehydrogenase (short-subunit alcohol dehydrogenase family)